MNFLKFIVSPISGAIIGYFTNWLAIKMLFRPHTEKRLFGVRLPFTPGLIPKERHRLSSAIGETIGSQLLTEEVIVDSLSTNEVKQSIQMILSKLYEGAANSEDTIDNLLDKLFHENKEAIVEKAISDISLKAKKIITDDQTINQITEHITNIITDFAKKPIAQYKLSRFSDRIETFYNKYAKEFSANDEFENLLHSFLKDLEGKASTQEKTIAEYLPKDTDVFIKNLAENNMKSIFDAVSTVINIEEVNLFIRKTLADIIDENVSKLMSLFINTDKITENIMTNFNEFLSKDENIPVILEKINSLTDKLISTELSKVVSKIPEDIRAAAGVKIVEAIRYIISDSNIVPKLIAAFNKFLEVNNEKNIYNFLEGIEPELGSKIKAIIISKSKLLLERHSGNLLDKVLRSTAHKLMQLKLSSITSIISKESFNSFEAYTLSNLETVIQKLAPHIITAVDIPKVVENRIDSFDVDTAEKIIISVVNKELKLITVLGGVLGFIIGFLPSIFSALGIY